MEEATGLGPNRTGLHRSPTPGRDLLDTPVGQPVPPGAGRAQAELRAQYLAEAGPLGSVPVPTTLKGIASTGMEALKGLRAQVLIDRMAARLAFERGGVRLYDALIRKHEAAGHPALESGSAETLREFRAQELAHMNLVADAIESLGGDSTAQTPAADLVGIESMGFVQVVSDPRTSFLQSLHAVLCAELTDVAGWDLLATLADEMGQERLAASFRGALAEEERHLRTVRAWHLQLTLADAQRGP